MVSDNIFVKITNREIYDKLTTIELMITKQAQDNKMNRRWLWSLTGGFCTGFLFIVGLILKVGK